MFDNRGLKDYTSDFEKRNRCNLYVVYRSGNTGGFRDKTKVGNSSQETIRNVFKRDSCTPGFWTPYGKVTRHYGEEPSRGDKRWK